MTESAKAPRMHVCHTARGLPTFRARPCFKQAQPFSHDGPTRLGRTDIRPRQDESRPQAAFASK
jgi:hypothetical protein